MRVNEMNRALQAKLGQKSVLRMVRWHCPPDTGFEIQTLAVWGQARYLSVTEAPHNTEFYEWMGKKHFCFFQTVETGKRTPWKAAVLTTTLGPPPMMRVRLTGRYRVLWGTRYWNPYPTLTMNPNCSDLIFYNRPTWETVFINKVKGIFWNDI